MADSSLLKIRLAETHTRPPRPPAPLHLSREAPARTARPPSAGAVRARPSQRKFFPSEGPEPQRAFWKGRGTEQEARAARAQEGAHGGVEHGAGRARFHLQPALHGEELPAQRAAPLRVHCHCPRKIGSSTTHPRTAEICIHPQCDTFHRVWLFG